MGLGTHTGPGPVLGFPTSVALGIQAWAQGRLSMTEGPPEVWAA